MSVLVLVWLSILLSLLIVRIWYCVVGCVVVVHCVTGDVVIVVGMCVSVMFLVCVVGLV